jgi:hypothetical protein
MRRSRCSRRTITSRARRSFRQSERVTGERYDFTWPLISGAASAQLLWHRLGSAELVDGAARLPQAPDEPGVYLVKLSAQCRYRIYIGEAANLHKRLQRYGGRGAERPTARGKTTDNMRGRVRRVLRNSSGRVEIYLLQLPVNSEYAMCPRYPGCKDCRIMLERVAIATAYLRHEPLINEHGFPEAVPGDPLQ